MHKMIKAKDIDIFLLLNYQVLCIGFHFFSGYKLFIFLISHCYINVEWNYRYDSLNFQTRETSYFPCIYDATFSKKKKVTGFSYIKHRLRKGHRLRKESK